MTSITHLRREYTWGGLRRKDLNPDPILQFQHWFKQALEAQEIEPHAMTLATAAKDGQPSARTVLLREADQRGFVFYTNYESRKGKELEENPKAALAFYWPVLERQVCITGHVTKISRGESEAYFRSRPLGSQIAAWVSRQSQVVENREVLDDAVKEKTNQFQNKDIPIPHHWGGFLLIPQTIEFWQGRPSRLHDRFCYTKQADGKWKIDRLYP